MEYALDLIISAFELLLSKEYGSWSIGSITPEAYFELRIQDPHHHCPCSPEAAEEIVLHFRKKGLSLHHLHHPGSAGVLFLKKI